MTKQEPKTIYKVRLSGARVSQLRDVGCLIGIFIVLFGLFALFGAVQVYLCKKDDPEASVVECLKAR